MNLFGRPAADGTAIVQQSFDQANDPRVMVPSAPPESLASSCCLAVRIRALLGSPGTAQNVPGITRPTRRARV